MPLAAQQIGAAQGYGLDWVELQDVLVKQER